MATSDSLQGTLDLLVLKTLSRRPRLHGYALMAAIHDISRDVLRVEEGSLYPALHRMEVDGIVASEWGQSENNRRAKFYRLTPLGRKQLARKSDKWNRLSSAIARVMLSGAGPWPAQ